MGWFRPEHGSVREEQKQECAAVRSTGALSRLTAVVVEKCLNIAVLLVVFTMVFGVGKMLDAGWSVMGWINRTLGQDSTGEVAGGTSQEAVSEDEPTTEGAEDAGERQLGDYLIKENPALWSSYQKLKAATSDLDQRITGLERAIVGFGRSPEDDSDYLALCRTRDEELTLTASMRERLVDLYLFSQKSSLSAEGVARRDAVRRALEVMVRRVDAMVR